MNRPAHFSEPAATLELKETPFSAPPTALDFNGIKEPIDTPFQVEWDDFDTGTLDD